MAHPNVQQLLASIWYEGLPGFRRKNMALQALEIVRIGMITLSFSIRALFTETMNRFAALLKFNLTKHANRFLFRFLYR